MLNIYKFILLILLVDKKHFIIIFLIDFNLYIIFYEVCLVYYFVVNNKGIKIINRFGYI